MLLVNVYGHCDIFEGKRFSDKKIMNFVSKKVVCEKTVVNSIIYLPRSFSWTDGSLAQVFIAVSNASVDE